MEKALDRDAAPHLGPAMPRDQLFDDGIQPDAVQRIAGMGTGRLLAHAMSTPGWFAGMERGRLPAHAVRTP
jgi:hypothetical protein